MIENNSLPVKKIIFIALIVITFITLFSIYNYVSSNGKLVINMSSQSTISVEIDGASSLKIDNYTPGTQITLKKGDYNVKLYGDNANSFLSANVPGFFKTESLDANLKQVEGLSIIASNPDDCVGQSNNRLYSFPCGRFYSKVQLHNPGTENSPSYISSQNTYQNWNDIFNYKGNSYGVIFEPDIGYSMVSFPDKDNYYRALNFFTASENTENQIISVRPYSEGVIVYSLTSTEAYYLANLDAEPQKVSLESIPVIEDSYFDVSIYNQYVTYSYQSGYDEGVNDSSKPLNLSYSDGNISKVVEYPSKLQKPFICGENMLCGLDDTKFAVYEITNNKTGKGKYISDVSEFYTFNRGLYLVIGGDVVSYSPSSDEGFISFNNSSNQQFCGMNDLGGKLTFCVIGDDKMQNSLIIISEDSQEHGDIIGQVNILSKNNYVKKISIYKNFIYITTNVAITKGAGEEGYSKNQDSSNIAKQSILSQANSLGINTDKYSFVIY